MRPIAVSFLGMMLAGCCTDYPVDGDGLAGFSAAYDRTTSGYLVSWWTLDQRGPGEVDAIAYLGVLAATGTFAETSAIPKRRGPRFLASGDGRHLLSALTDDGVGLSVVSGAGVVVASDVLVVPHIPDPPVSVHFEAVDVTGGFLVLSATWVLGTYDLTMVRMDADGVIVESTLVVTGVAYSGNGGPIPYAIARAQDQIWLAFQDGPTIRARQVSVDGVLGPTVTLLDNGYLMAMAAADDRILCLARAERGSSRALVSFIDPSGTITTGPPRFDIPGVGAGVVIDGLIAFPGAGYLLSSPLGPSATWLDLDGAATGTIQKSLGGCAEDVVAAGVGAAGVSLACSLVLTPDEHVSMLFADPVSFGGQPSRTGSALVKTRVTIDQDACDHP